jgi:RHH-type proline utilization regulon transcriptional repressor/proline dehydrogenase/delta 1-pyrroline-5-carboxylate dehydrogenase
VNQIVDASISPEEISKDPVSQWQALGDSVSNPNIELPANIYGESRLNAKGWDITDLNTLESVNQKRALFAQTRWHGRPLVGEVVENGEKLSVYNPADPSDCVGDVIYASAIDVDTAIKQAKSTFPIWQSKNVKERANTLRRIADYYEANADELFALLAREAGKNWLDAVGEVREAVDFARYYAEHAENLDDSGNARGVIACISPWNFPLAIFSGQIFAAIAGGNVVIAKPAEQTSLIAARAVELMYEAGLADGVVQLLPGSGAIVGDALTGHEEISGICFTGSTATAQRINRNMAGNLAPDAPLIAETGGLNAMIVDSTALPEQVVRDVVASAFQSAGQLYSKTCPINCSACFTVQWTNYDSITPGIYTAMLGR